MPGTVAIYYYFAHFYIVRNLMHKWMIEVQKSMNLKLNKYTHHSFVKQVITSLDLAHEHERYFIYDGMCTEAK